MKLIKKLMIGAAMAASMMSAQAAMINVGGVVWDPADVNDFGALGGIIHQEIATTGTNKGEAYGFGLITSINESATINDFCPGCQLTFQFYGFMPIAVGTLPTTVGQSIAYTGGTIDVFVHAPTITNINAASSLSQANTGLNGGQLWLQLSGHGLVGSGASLVGTVLGGVDGKITGLTGVGQLDAVAGLAVGNFDTNTTTEGSDMTFSTSFTKLIPDNNPNFANGNGTFSSNTIPEPGSLALIGLGLMGAAMVRRRKA